MAGRDNWIRHSHPSHAQFNELLATRAQALGRKEIIPSYVANAPNMGREFQRNRDHLIAKQMDDLDKTEKQRREEAQGRGSSMVETDRPEAHLRPPPALRRTADRSTVNKTWTRELCQAAMANRQRDHRDRTKERHQTGYTQGTPEHGQ